ncbi:haloacid dehalogenase [Parenemella sanctibonifatiensis]|uniref:Haloacid dehalogenase n=2 Tax=Parenemella sanctibonifatiensis TaxID=2016505 RepID=A0A255ETL5_9ACTN|nr:haloacid dehalogenase [Parenemella sanctibonifatiensis]
MGGTLIDTYPELDAALCRAALGEVTEAGLDEVAELTRVSTGHAIEVLAQRHGVPEDDLNRANEQLKRHWRTHPAPVMDGAVEVMEQVRRSGHLNLVVTHRERASAEGLLSANGLHVDDMICAPDGHPRKPAPDMYVAILERNRIQSHEALAVGDRMIDVEAAGAAGVAGVLLDTSPTQSVRATGTRTVSSLRALLAGAY